MFKIDKKIIEGVKSCGSKEELQIYLQNAVELEHATIPPYLTAMWSLKSGLNDEIAKLIRSIVIEEMLHMTISANVLIAIGGSPQINNPQFIPNYPGTLPMGVADGLIVPIKAFSKNLVKDVFMKIEEPEKPIPVNLKSEAVEEKYGTIGEFYHAIQNQIKKLGNGIFVAGSEKKQVLSWLDRLFPITDVDSAIRAIDIIVIEGEGTNTVPYDSSGDPAHYYRFGEIYYGKKIIKTADGFAYGGEPVPFDENGVYPVIDNPSASSYLEGSLAATLSKTFSYSYSCLLNALHTCFNGSPETIDKTIGLMFQLRLQAQALMKTTISKGSEQTAGPVFQYLTSN